MEDRKTLWFGAGRSRNFLVPDGLSLPSGDYELKTSIGRRMAVEESAVAPFEVSREEAAAWSRRQLQSLLGGETRGEEAATGSEQGTELPIFSALSGESSEDLHADPEALRRGLRQVGEKLGGVVRDALSASEEDRRQTRDDLEGIRATVAEAEASKAGQGAGEDDAGDEARRRGAEKALRSVADLAGSLGRAAERAGARFGEAADELRAQREAAKASADDGPVEGSEAGVERTEAGDDGPGSDEPQPDGAPED